MLYNITYILNPYWQISGASAKPISGKLIQAPYQIWMSFPGSANKGKKYLFRFVVNNMICSLVWNIAKEQDIQ